MANNSTSFIKTMAMESTASDEFHVFNETSDSAIMDNFTSIFAAFRQNLTNGGEFTPEEMDGFDLEKIFSIMKKLKIASTGEEEERINSLASSIIKFSYIFLIIIGLIANILVIGLFLYNKKSMATARNLFIINLAISDVLLCSFTMPVTVMDLTTQYFSFTENQVYVCQLIGSMQSICVFFSSFSITLIAVDRYKSIVRSSESQFTITQAIMLSFVAALASVGMSMPVLWITKIMSMENPITRRPISYCYEEWSSPHIKSVYSVICMIIQYIIPSIIVGWCYHRVIKRLNSPTSLSASSRVMIRRAQNKKTSTKMIFVSLVFFTLWAPLNIYNIFLVVIQYVKVSLTEEDLVIQFSIFHLIAMLTVIANPIMYGYLNSNFKQCLMNMCAQCIKSWATDVEANNKEALTAKPPITQSEQATHTVSQEQIASLDGRISVADADETRF